MAAKIKHAPKIIRPVKTSLNNNTEKSVPKMDSVDKMSADFVGSAYCIPMFWQA